MIVVVGRPALRAPEDLALARPGGLTADVAISLAQLGVPTELLGSVGDDEEGDRVVVELGRSGVGHAAVLRDPSTRTPLLMSEGRAPASLPRLEAADIELGLRYLPECRVLVLTEPLEDGPRAAALEGAAFHDAAVVAVLPAGSAVPDDLAARSTVLSVPDAAFETGAAFTAFLASYAAGIARGADPRESFRGALTASGWEPSGGGADE
ncbi:hypothetical protein BH23CHL8_BH23CHL8_19450 [soil metagenome]